MKAILIEQFEACFDQSAWFASAVSALADLQAEDALWKPNAEVHSVWEIITHLNFYNYKHLQRFKGIDVANETIEIAETYTPSEQDWETALEKFNSIMSEWKSLLEGADEAKFSERVSPKIDSEWSSIIAHINIHNAYHIGQIVTVRKLRGNWNGKQAVS